MMQPEGIVAVSTTQESHENRFVRDLAAVAERLDRLAGRLGDIEASLARGRSSEQERGTLNFATGSSGRGHSPQHVGDRRPSDTNWRIPPQHGRQGAGAGFRAPNSFAGRSFPRGRTGNRGPGNGR